MDINSFFVYKIFLTPINIGFLFPDLIHIIFVKFVKIHKLKNTKIHLRVPFKKIFLFEFAVRRCIYFLREKKCECFGVRRLKNVT